jgi:hypothetical protein
MKITQHAAAPRLWTLFFVCLMFIALNATTASAQLTWTKRTSNTNAGLRAVAYGNNMFMAVGDSGTVLTSADGITWVKRNTGRLQCYYKGIVFFNSKFITVADSISAAYTLAPFICYASADGVTWTRGIIASTYSTTITSLQADLAVGNNELLAIHSYSTTTPAASTTCQVYRSTTGLTWTNKSLLSPYALNALCYGKSVYVLGGASACYSSSDDSVWINRTSTGINDIIFANNQFMACGTGIKASADGMTWTSKNTAITGLKGLVFTGTLYLAAGAAGKIAQSSIDIGTWTSTTPVDTNSLNSVAYGKNVAVAVGNKGKIITASTTQTVLVHSITESTPTFSLSGLHYSLPSAGMVNAQLYDVRGQFVATLVSSYAEAGAHCAAIPARLTSGNYLLSFKSGNISVVRPVAVVR